MLNLVHGSDPKMKNYRLGRWQFTYYPSTQEESGIEGQPGLHGTLSQKRKKRTIIILSLFQQLPLLPVQARSVLSMLLKH